MRRLCCMVQNAALVLCGLGCFAVAAANGQEITAKEAKMGAPVLASQHPNFNARAMSPPNAHALRNFKQQRLREHHLSVPVKPAPGAAQAAPKPQAESATPITAIFAPQDDSGVTLVANRALSSAETNAETSTVCEPSVAARGNEVLFTGNWFAAISKNGGATFSYRNPYSIFPASPQGGFCCDQVAIYDKGNDLMCWALQYVNNTTGNTLRLAVAKGDDIANEQWHYYDFTPQNIGQWPNEWFDFPDLALGQKNLYVTSNVFGTASNDFKRSVLLRLPLDQLSAYQALNYNYHSDDNFAPRATQGAGDTMYWAMHRDLATLKVFTWPESGTAIQTNDVAIQTWSDAPRVAPGPDGRDWLGRADGRITSAWVSSDTIGFAWSAAQDSNFHFPHVRVAVLDRNNKSVSAQPHIWNNNFAYAYPAAAPNADAKVGISLHFGGGAIYPSHAVGIYPYQASQQWHLVSTAAGKFGPSDNKWGDYQAVRKHGTDPKTWVATGYTLQTGPNAGDIEVRYILFR